MNENQLAGELITLIQKTEQDSAASPSVKVATNFMKAAVVVLTPKLVSPAQPEFKTVMQIAKETGIDLSPMFPGSDASHLTVDAATILNYFEPNASANDPKPFMVCRPADGFIAFIISPGAERAPYTVGQPIRDGDKLWLVSEQPTPPIGNTVCCTLFRPKFGGLFLHGQMFAVAGGTQTGFEFHLTGDGKNTEVDLRSAYV